MVLIINIFILVLLITASTLCVFLIVYVKKYYEQVDAVRKDFNQLVENTIPILNNLEEVTGRVNSMAASVGEYWDGIDKSIKSLQSMISVFNSWKIIRFAKIYSPKLLNNFRSVAKGITTFRSELKNK